MYPYYMKKIISLFLLFIVVCVSAYSQKNNSLIFYGSIKNYNISKLWLTDSIQKETDASMPFPEPLGYIGDNFQRFYIHFISVTKSAANPYEYVVTGKTRVKNNICSFKGTLVIENATLNKESEPEFPQYKRGSVYCAVNFYEDSTQAGSGYIKGRLITGFYLDKKNKLYYDRLWFTDAFENNQCKAVWTSYKTKKSKKCNWGDYRIPESGDLDGGAGDFIPDQKYIANGWEEYADVYSTDDTKPVKAPVVENKKWWQ